MGRIHAERENRLLAKEGRAHRSDTSYSFLKHSSCHSIPPECGGRNSRARCWSMKNRLSLVAGIFAVLLISVSLIPSRSVAALAAGSMQLPIGKNCTVQLRRGDGLGAAATP